MDLRSRRAGTKRALGTSSLLAGLLISVITLANEAETIKPHILAGLLVLVGVGLRIEAAISDSRT